MEKQHHLPLGEKNMIVKAHRYFLEHSAKRGPGVAPGVRRQVAECLGVGESTVDRVLAAYNRDNTTFSQPSQPVDRGRPPISYPDEAVTFARKIANEKNLNCEPLSVPTLKIRLKEECELDITERTLHRLLVRAGFRFGEGKKRNFLAEMDGPRALHAQYLRFKLSFRNANKLPTVPEVFLDESYCNLHHTKNQTWIDTANNIQYTNSGKGPRLCIVGAGVVFATNDKLNGEFVRDSLQIWDSKTKSSEDYHGNFNAALFEAWFEKLCATLREDYGDCRIFMNGARYHRRNMNPVPRTSWLKEDIRTWLTERQVVWETTMKKTELLALAQVQHERPLFACVEIARLRGHVVYFTPPYHPELQPIEKIWAVGKNNVGRNPAKTMAELKVKVRDSFINNITAKTWIGAYKAVQLQEDSYTELEDRLDRSEKAITPATCETSDSESEEVVYAF